MKIHKIKSSVSISLLYKSQVKSKSKWSTY